MLNPRCLLCLVYVLSSYRKTFAQECSFSVHISLLKIFIFFHFFLHIDKTGARDNVSSLFIFLCQNFHILFMFYLHIDKTCVRDNVSYLFIFLDSNFSYLFMFYLHIKKSKCLYFLMFYFHIDKTGALDYVPSLFFFVS